MSKDSSVTELSKDADAKRTELTDTIDRIREHVVETGQRFSPDHLKGEAKQYFADKGKSWLDGLEQTARERPLQAIAVGAGLAYPMFSLVKAIPKPLLAIGAGLALLRYKPGTGSGAASDAAGNTGAAGRMVADRTADIMDASKSKLATVQGQVADRLDRVGDSVEAARSAVKDQAQIATASLSDAFSNAADSASAMAANANAAVRTAVTHGMNASADMTRQTGQFVGTIPGMAADAVRENVFLVAGVGLAIGAVLAAAIPATEAEEKVLGPIGANLKAQAHGLVDQGLGTLSTAAGDLYDRAVDAADAQGLNVDTAHRALSEVSGRVETIVNTVTGTSPQQNSQPSKPASTSPEFKS